MVEIRQRSQEMVARESQRTSMIAIFSALLLTLIAGGSMIRLTATWVPLHSPRKTAPKDPWPRSLKRTILSCSAI